MSHMSSNLTPCSVCISPLACKDRNYCNAQEARERGGPPIYGREHRFTTPHTTETPTMARKRKKEPRQLTGMHIVIAGNPVDGFQYYGPFKTPDDAILYTVKPSLNTEWWIAPLLAPDKVRS